MNSLNGISSHAVGHSIARIHLCWNDEDIGAIIDGALGRKTFIYNGDSLKTIPTGWNCLEEYGDLRGHMFVACKPNTIVARYLLQFDFEEGNNIIYVSDVSRSSWSPG